MINHYAARFGIRVYHYSINSNHIHLCLKSSHRKDLSDFLRVLSGQIAQRLSGAVRGKALEISFWANAIWSRLVFWGRDFKGVVNYIYQNQMEAAGVITYQPRDIKRKKRSDSAKITYQQSLF